jgi:hypothetical protein
MEGTPSVVDPKEVSRSALRCTSMAIDFGASLTVGKGAPMTVALRLDFSKLGLDDYDAVCRALNFPADWPEGLRSHCSTEVDGRLCVLDVWESRPQFDRFVENRLQGAMGQAVGERAEAPQITEMELHTFEVRS